MENTPATNSHNDPPPSTDEDTMSETAEKDAELIECLATELEDMEKDLKQVTRQLKEERSKTSLMTEEAEMHSKTKLKLEKMQDELAAVKAKNESLSEEISLLAVRRKSNDEWQTKEAAWQSKEATLNKAIEDKQAELKKSKKNNIEVANTLREIEGAVVGLQQELDAEKLKNQALTQSQASATAASVDSEKWHKREAELIRKIDRQQKELNKWKKDTSDGVVIMKELEAALRKARTENKDLRAIIEESKDAANNSSRLEKELTFTQNERDDALRELSSLRRDHSRLSEQSRCDTSNYEQIVKSNEELKGVLATTQSQLEDKVELLQKDLTQTKESKEKLKEDCKDLEDRYDQQKRETDEVRAALHDLANSFEEQKIDLELRSSEIEELKELHEASLEKHASELKASELHAQTQTKEVSSLQQTYKSQMLIFQSQIEALRESAIRNSDGPDDEVRAEIDDMLRFAQAQIEGLDSDHENSRLQKEVFTLRSHVSSAEGRESRLKQQMLLLSEELSETDAVYKKQISDLQAELDEMRAFGLSPRHKNLPLEARNAESDKDLGKKRKQIEFDALQDYVTQWQAFDP